MSKPMAFSFLTANRYIKLQEEYIKDEQRYVDSPAETRRDGR